MVWADLHRSPSPLPTRQHNLPNLMPLIFTLFPSLLFSFYLTILSNFTLSVLFYPKCYLSILTLFFFQPPLLQQQKGKKMMFTALKLTQCFRKELSIPIQYSKRSTAGESEPSRKISEAQQDNI